MRDAHLVLSILFIMLPGCRLSVSSPVPQLDPETSRAATQIRFFEAEPPDPYMVVGKAQSISCARNALYTPNLAVARSMLRVEAMRMGAHGLTNVQCIDKGVTFFHNCFAQIVCKGVAVYLLEPDPGSSGGAIQGKTGQNH